MSCVSSRPLLLTLVLWGLAFFLLIVSIFVPKEYKICSGPAIHDCTSPEYSEDCRILNCHECIYDVGNGVECAKFNDRTSAGFWFVLGIGVATVVIAIPFTIAICKQKLNVKLLPSNIDGEKQPLLT
jgi:hypothetical protein